MVSSTLLQDAALWLPGIWISQLDRSLPLIPPECVLLLCRCATVPTTPHYHCPECDLVVANKLGMQKHLDDKECSPSSPHANQVCLIRPVYWISNLPCHWQETLNVGAAELLLEVGFLGKKFSVSCALWKPSLCLQVKLLVPHPSIIKADDILARGTLIEKCVTSDCPAKCQAEEKPMFHCRLCPVKAYKSPQEGTDQHLSYHRRYGIALPGKNIAQEKLETERLKLVLAQSFYTRQTAVQFSWTRLLAMYSSSRHQVDK